MYSDNDFRLYHHGIKGQKWGIQNGPPYPLKGFSSPNELSNHMRGFKYKEFDRLMSPDSVGKTKSGSCHDQVMYELQQLRRMGYDPKAEFVIEYNPKTNSGGTTHSFVYYNDGNKTVWFENAWGGREGVHAYRNLKDIRNSINRLHKNGEFGSGKEFSKLEFAPFVDSHHQIGESLQDLVDICLDEKRKEG